MTPTCQQQHYTHCLGSVTIWLRLRILNHTYQHPPAHPNSHSELSIGPVWIRGQWGFSHQPRHTKPGVTVTFARGLLCPGLTPTASHYSPLIYTGWTWSHDGQLWCTGYRPQWLQQIFYLAWRQVWESPNTISMATNQFSYDWAVLLSLIMSTIMPTCSLWLCFVCLKLFL